jgi:DNA-binding NarL/FixJ family response regulator
MYVVALPVLELAMTLTTRERQVLALLASGLRDRQIATQLGLSENTIKTHTRNLLAKLGAHSRAHAIAISFCLDLLQPESDCASVHAEN